MMSKSMVAILIGLACAASWLVVSVSAQQYEDCTVHKWLDSKCSECCEKRREVGVPTQGIAAPGYCSCITPKRAAYYACEHDVKLEETKEQRAACDNLEAETDGCAFCCAQRLRVPGTSLLGGKCSCRKGYKKVTNSDGSRCDRKLRGMAGIKKALGGTHTTADFY